jgi:FkbM family methyltransferase
MKNPSRALSARSFRLPIRAWTWLGLGLQALPEFPTKGRWEWMWFQHRDQGRVERRRLPGGAIIDCYLSDYYETWIWMRLLDAAELDVLRQLLHPGESFVDVGAHIGLWSLIAGTAVGTGGKVFALEPSPEVYPKLVHNLNLNRDLTTWLPSQIAADAQTGTVGFELSEFSACSHVTNTAEDAIQVASRTIDELICGERIAGMKIDVEGHEQAVIQGAGATIDEFHPWLCIEFNNRIHQLDNLASWSVDGILRGTGYKCWLFRDALRSHTTPPLQPDFFTGDYVNLFYRCSSGEEV